MLLAIPLKLSVDFVVVTATSLTNQLSNPVVPEKIIFPTFGLVLSSLYNIHSIAVIPTLLVPLAQTYFIPSWLINIFSLALFILMFGSHLLSPIQ